MQAALNILEIIGEISGLKINSEKTKLIWIGSEVTSKRMLKVSHKLCWVDTQFNLLGIHFSSDLTKLPSLNYLNTLAKAKKTINTWKFRHLTPIGKIIVIKTLILSIFTNFFMALPTPVEILVKINKLLFNFMRDGKPDKISRDRICTTQLNGGLKMINIHKFEKSIKLRWLKQIFIGNKKSWLDLLLNNINLSYFSSFGSQWCLSKLAKLNQFWKIVFTYYNNFCHQVLCVLSCCFILSKNMCVT